MFPRLLKEIMHSIMGKYGIVLSKQNKSSTGVKYNS